MSTKQKGPDEVFCTSCGEAIKQEAEICPECGVRNKNQKSTTSNPSPSNPSPSPTPHDPSQYETTVSDTWWYGIGAGLVIWTIGFALFNMASGGLIEEVLNLLLLIGWLIMPISIYFDAKYVRANSRWNPNTLLYVIGSILWVVNVVTGAIYLYRRHESVGES